MKKNFKQNIELDARLVLAGMKGGIDAIMNTAFLMRDQLPTTKDATDRCEWLKRQPEEYINKVCDRVAELEKD
jgi:hypothetical protein